MFGIDLTTALIILAVLVVMFFVIDFLFAGGGMTSGMMGATTHCGAAVMGSPYGWMVIVAIVILVLIAFGMTFGAR